MSTNTTFEVHPTRSVFDASRTALGALISSRPRRAVEDQARVRVANPDPAVPVVLRVPLRLPEDRPGCRRLERPRRGRFRGRCSCPVSRHLGHVPGCPIDCAHDVPRVRLHREIEDRVQAPCPIWLVAMSKVLSGSVQGLIAALIVFRSRRWCTPRASKRTSRCTG